MCINVVWVKNVFSLHVHSEHALSDLFLATYETVLTTLICGYGGRETSIEVQEQPIQSRNVIQDKF